MDGKGGTQSPDGGLSRSSSRMTLRTVPTSDPTSAHPLDAPAPLGATGGNGGSYVVYDKARKRAGSNSLSTNVLSPPSSILSPSETPLAPSPIASSAGTTPPFTPSSTHSLPPLVSRPSNSQLPPAAQRRQYARSVSEAKEQLQRQALKAELRDLGLSAESAGAALVARLGTLEDDPDLKRLVPVVRSGKTTLLLPAERLEGEGPLPVPFLLDHLALFDPPSTSPESLGAQRPFATLSGIRGVLSDGELVFTSCVHLPRDAQAEPLEEETAQRYLRGVTPLPAPPPSTHYPTSMLISAFTNLSIPQSRSNNAMSPPPTSRTTSRLAALFAKPAGQSSDGPTASTPTTAADGSTAVDLPEARPHSRHADSVDVPVLAIGKTIKRAEVAGTMSSALLSHLRGQMRSIEGFSGEADVGAAVDAFARQLATLPETGFSAAEEGEMPAPNLLDDDVEVLSEAYQEMMHDVRLDLARNLGSPSEVSATSQPSMEDFAQLEERIDGSLEQLEAVLTATMYDRLFAPPNAHDLQEDENLASRIAALNVLGLDLEHLGIDLAEEQELQDDDWRSYKTGPRDSLEMLASRVGKALNRLEYPKELTPSAKLDILIECHKIIVDGLSDLPPVQLKKEASPDDKSSLSDRPAVVEMDDASSRASSRPPSRPRSPTRLDDDEAADSSDGDMLKTPRPPSYDDRPVPEIRLPESARGLADPVSDATSSSVLAEDHSPPVSIFESTRNRDRPPTSSTASSSADLILPLLIYSVVRANPPHLVSHLRYIHRFRTESLLRGQASYCATNFDAVIEWSQHVDLSTLGLSSENVVSPAANESSENKLVAPTTSRPRAFTTPSSLLRERVSLTADQLVDTAGTALTGVVDSSYRLLFGAGGLASSAPKTLDEVKNVLDGARGRAREKLPFRRSNSARDFPTLIAGRRRAATATDGKPASIAEAEDNAPASSSGAAPPPPLPPRPQSPTKAAEDDTRSVRSVSSFLGFRDSSFGRAIGAQSSSTVPAERTEGGSPESSPSSSSLGGRLFGRLADGASSSARRATLLNPLSGWTGPHPALAPIPASPAGDALDELYKPVQRFLDVDNAQDLKLGEVQELLAEYRKAVSALRLHASAKQAGTSEAAQAGSAASQDLGEKEA